jgi:2-amino-4-hydroxy-6-hydroxymethyldihydropteridine diphosphokinase
MELPAAVAPPVEYPAPFKVAGRIMARCLVGCGSNLGRRREQLDRAVELLRCMPGVRMLAVSRFRETRPVGGPVGQSPYLNGACLLETDLGPHDVLGMLNAVENTLHRERTERWGERTLDLDLLLYGDLVVDDAALTVPHPRMATRRFVLEPAVEIAADFEHPLAACSLRALLDNISAPHPLVAVVGVPGSGAAEVAAAVGDAVLARVIHAPRPFPLPTPATGPQAWHDLLAAWVEPLASAAGPDDPHGTVIDYCLDAIAAAAAVALSPTDAVRLEAALDRAARRVPVPHVAILLVASADVLEERVAMGCAFPGNAGDSGAGLHPATATLCGASSTGAALVDLQERLVRRLRGPGPRGPLSPKAVVTVDASDLARAVAEATAAVEAMV